MKNKNIIVIKFGGSIFSHEENRKRFFKDIKTIINSGYHPLIVHGGGSEATDMLKKLDIPSRFIKGLRYTSDRILEVVEMIFSGKVNRRLVGDMNRINIKAVGISGRDASFITARRIIALGRVGKVKKVDTSFLELLIKNSYVPVISSIGVDANSNALNINADEAAYGIAVAMRAQRLIFMTDTKGVLENIDCEHSLISTIHIKDIKQLISKKIVHGGMLPKVLASRDAVQKGVKEVDIIDGREKGVLMRCFKDDGLSGTRIKK